MQVLGSVARALDFPLTTPWNKLPESAREAVLYGTQGEAIALRFEDGRKSYEVVKPFEGVIRNLERRLLRADSAWRREELGKVQASAPCAARGRKSGVSGERGYVQVDPGGRRLIKQKDT